MMTPTLRTFQRHPLCILIAGALLSACGGSSDGTPAPLVPPVTVPIAPVDAAVTLLGESVVKDAFVPGGVAVDAAGTIYVGNRSAKQVPITSNILSPLEIVKISQAGTVSPFINRGSSYTGAGSGSYVYSGRVVQLAYDAASQTLYALDGSGMDEQFSATSIRPVSAAGVVGTINLAPAPTHANTRPLPATVAQRASALAVGPDGVLHAFGTGSDVQSGTPGSGRYTLSFDGWQTVNPDGSGRIVYAQESGAIVRGALDPTLPFSYTYPADLASTSGRLGANEAGLAVDSAGNGYIADSGRHAIVKVTPSGAASILAGSVLQAGSSDGSGAAARFNAPSQLVLDKAGNVFVLDSGNATVRKITPAGVVTTVLGVAGQSQTRTGALPGGLGAPKGLAIDAAGRLYVTVDKGVLRANLQ